MKLGEDQAVSEMKIKTPPSSRRRQVGRGRRRSARGGRMVWDGVGVNGREMRSTEFEISAVLQCERLNLMRIVLLRPHLERR